MPYVITEPESIKGVCEIWDECRSKVEGVKGAKYQKVHDEAEAQALLKGTGVVLKPGLHVFTDRNQRGGVGVVIVWMGENPSDDPTVVAEIASSVGRIFYGGVLPALGSEEEVELALQKSRKSLSWAACTSRCGRHRVGFRDSVGVPQVQLIDSVRGRLGFAWLSGGDRPRPVARHRIERV